MSKKNCFLTIFLFSCLVLCIKPSYADEVLTLKSSNIKPYNDALEGFKNSCNCDVDEQAYQDMQASDISEVVSRSKPDAVLAIGLDAFRTARKIKNIPVIYIMVPRPDLPGPENNNISGVNISVPPLRQLEAIIEIFPRAKRIGLLASPPEMDAYTSEVLNTARNRGVELIIKTVYKTGDVPALIEGMKHSIDVLWMVPDTKVLNAETVKYMLLFSFENKVPVFTFTKKYVEMGAVAALNAEPSDMGGQAGEIAKKVIRGGSFIRTDPGKTRVIINKKIAKKMGIRINEEVMRKAEDVD